MKLICVDDRWSKILQETDVDARLMARGLPDLEELRKRGLFPSPEDVIKRIIKMFEEGAKGHKWSTTAALEVAVEVAGILQVGPSIRLEATIHSDGDS